MITLSKSGNTVTFTFDENSGYLQNGTIDVPVNSLSLVIDDSDMATFRKAASNDIFISARYEEFGMTKAQLEAWYKANMVDSITEEEIQDMIDTSTANYFDNAVYDSGTTMINFYHGNTVKASIDASQFVIDGMIDDVRIETISGVTYLVIDFNTASGKEDIQIPLTDIFDPSNYYTKQEVDASLSGKVNTTTYTAYTSSTQTTLYRKLNRSEVINELNQWATEPVQSKVLFNELRISALTMDDGCDTIEECVDILENNADDWSYDEGYDEYRSHYCPSYLRKVDFTISADTECSCYVGVQDSNYNGQVHVNFTYYPAITDPDDPSYPQDAYIDNADLYVEVNNDDFEPLSSSTFSVSGTSITLEIPNFIVYDEWEGVYKYFNWTDDTGGDALRYQLNNGVGEYISGAVTASASGAVVTYTPVKDAVEDVEESLSGKQDTLSAGTNITISGNVISASGGISSGDVQTMIDSSISGKVDTSAFTAYTASTESRITEDEEVTAAGLNSLNETFTAYTAATDAVLSGKQDTLSAGTNITISGNVISAEGGGKAVSGGTNISITTGETADTINCTLPISAAKNSSILIGVNCSANREKSFVGGQSSTGNSEGSFAFGQHCKAGQWAIAVGNGVDASNIRGAAAFGEYNVSSGDRYSDSSGNTLFSVGNGTGGGNARHNAFEIRQNGDIYLSLNGQDVKLQDQLGGSSITVDTALNSGSTNPVENRVIYNKIDEVEQVAAAALNNINDRLSEDEEVTAAGLNAVNSALGGLKLQQITQSDYNNLQTKDPSTLYIIVN